MYQPLSYFTDKCIVQISVSIYVSPVQSTPLHVHTYTYSCVHTYMYSITQAYMQTRTCIDTYITYMHSYIHASIHSRIHSHRILRHYLKDDAQIVIVAEKV